MKPKTPESQHEAALLKAYLNNRKLWGYMAKRVGPDSVDDVIQESYLKARGAIAGGNYCEQGEMDAWFFQVARNAAADHLRKQQVRRADSIDTPDVSDICDTSARNPLEIVSQKETISEVFKAMATLDPKRRQAIILVDYEGYSLEEAAEKLGEKLGTVKSRIFRGREKLREIMLTRI